MPTKASIPLWMVLNITILLAITAIVYSFWVRYPEIYTRSGMTKELRTINDPTHGTSNWMDKQEAGEHFSFGTGPGILLGRLEGEIIRHDNPRMNRNCIVFGPPLTGKTWSLVFPNVLQAVISEESAIITDPKGEIMKETLKMAQNKGYAVRSFNLVNMEASDRWNPIEEVKTDLDAYLLSQVIIENTEGAQHRPMGDKFWERSEQNLLIAMILYIAHEASPENRNLAGLYDLLTNGSFDELDATFKSLPDGHQAKRPYNLFCMTERKNQGNIIQGLGTRLKVFQTDAVRKLTEKSDIDLELPGRRKSIYYCNIPDSDNTFQFLSSLFFSFLFHRLTRQGDRFGGPNPVRVNFIMDEFCTIGILPDFTSRIATMRSRNINCMMVTQSLPQLKGRYPYESWKEIIGCCSLRLIWGSAEKETSQYISDLLGKATVEEFSYRRSSGAFDPASITKAPRGRALLDLSEVGRIPFDEGIALVLGANPLRFRKMPYTEHSLAGELEPVKKYVPVKDRGLDDHDIIITGEYEETSTGWEGWIAN
ncbi:MAG: type IV secretory system conjugative DNA transfer family protein [Syntrophaceticus sp.]|nr:type IV secretory system conjugative DNA transfer family protein [Syntrophaceticus sp.]